MAKEYIGKLQYICRIMTPNRRVAREVYSDEKISPKVGDIVRVDGIAYQVGRVRYRYDFDRYERVCMVHLDEI